MKKTIKRLTVVVTAIISLSMSVTGMSSNAYWTTQSFASGNATAYLSVSTGSVAAYTDSSLTNITRSVFISHINYNAEPMAAPYYKYSSSGRVDVYVAFSGITTAHSRHTLAGYPVKEISMVP